MKAIESVIGCIDGIGKWKAKHIGIGHAAVWVNRDFVDIAKSEIRRVCPPTYLVDVFPMPDKQWLRFGLQYKKRRNYNRVMAVLSMAPEACSHHRHEASRQNYFHSVCRVMYKKGIEYSQRAFVEATSTPGSILGGERETR